MDATTLARPHRRARRVSPRTSVCWTVWTRVRGRSLCFRTVDVSARGAKLRPKCDLPVGTPLTLRFVNPSGAPIRVEAMVWREDRDGLGVMFLGSAPPGLG